MFEREHGYDPRNNYWFWAKYTPAGGVMEHPRGAAVAGLVANGSLPPDGAGWRSGLPSRSLSTPAKAPAPP